MIKETSEVNDTYMQNLVKALESDLEPSLLEIVNQTYLRLITPVEELKTSVYLPLSNMLKLCHKFYSNLMQYQSETVMDTNFYM